MNRRRFLGWLTKAAIGLSALPYITSEQVDKIKEIALEDDFVLTDEIFNYYRKALIANFERDNAFYEAISKKPINLISSRDMRIPFRIKPGGRFVN